jgi:ornithine--oxo-acid transaminase
MSIAALPSTGESLYQQHVNPQWSRLLHLMGLDARYQRCSGAELRTSDGRTITDFLSGYCVHNAGHNHPAIVAAVRDELDRSGPAMLQSNVPELAGVLAERLCQLAGGGLTKVSFSSSGSEAVETAIKFSRARTGRIPLLAASGAFHGLTCGALSLMDNPFWRGDFGPLLPDVEIVPFGDAEALREKLSTRRFAAFFVEPLQSEGGVRIPPPGYLAAAQSLCKQNGSLLVLDEVQTGLGRTGSFLAAHQLGVNQTALQPDMVLLAKALSGGLIPVSAVLMSDDIYDAVYSSVKRAIVHTSTFSENSLAMRAGIATLEVLESEGLVKRAAVLGAQFRDRLSDQLFGYEMVKEVRGMGLLNGIEFAAPTNFRLRAIFETFRKLHPALFGQVLVMRLFRDHNILTQICGNHFLVLKAAPPLIVSEQQLERFVRALRQTIEQAHSSASFWAEPLGIARRALSL